MRETDNAFTDRPWWPRIAWAACLLGLVQASGQESPGAKKTLYARHAVEGDATVKSPDGAKSVALRPVENDQYTSIVVRAAGKKFVAHLPGFRSEVLWSPDSQAFAVNQTEGGGGIGQRTYVFYVEMNQLRKVDVSRSVERAFGSPVKCEVPVPPNTAVLKWLDAQGVLVAAEVVPVSLCNCPNTFKSYEVSLPQPRIMRSYTQAETKRLFAGSLGFELSDADDACATRWQKSRAMSGMKSF
jgi:hypothetical protein